MRRERLSLLVILTLFLTSLIAPSHANTIQIASCASINRSASVTHGIVLPCLDGKSKVIYQAIRGPVIVNVFGSWCGPCNVEIPHLLAVAGLHKVPFVGVDVEETNMKAGSAFAKKKGLWWPILFDTNGSTRGIFGLGVPVTWLIDAQGKVVYKQIGVITSTDILKNEIKKYLKIKL